MDRMIKEYKLIVDCNRQYLIKHGKYVARVKVNGIKLENGVYDCQSIIEYERPSLVWSDGCRYLYQANATVTVNIGYYQFEAIPVKLWFDDNNFPFCHICGNWGEHQELWLPLKYATTIRDASLQFCHVRGKLVINQ